MVGVDNFVRAETDRMFAALQARCRRREPSSAQPRADRRSTDQPVIRMNRDTLYSFAIVDISEGATLTVPDSGDRYCR